MNIDGQRHHWTANIEIVGEGQDGDEDLPQLEGHVVEQLHRLLLQVARAALGVENFTNVLETRSGQIIEFFKVITFSLMLDIRDL